jgi:hypothetical protein
MQKQIPPVNGCFSTGYDYPCFVHGKFAPPPRGVNYARRKRESVMQGTTQPIDRQTLLEKANKLIREHEDTLAGIEATDVVQRNGVLVFSGEFYLDEQGLPTPKSTAVFNMFKYLAHELSDKYHLVD